MACHFFLTSSSLCGVSYIHTPVRYTLVPHSIPLCPRKRSSQAHRGDQHRVKWRSFGASDAKTGPSLEDPDFWRKVLYYYYFIICVVANVVYCCLLQYWHFILIF